jgi:hypothetical protein
MDITINLSPLMGIVVCASFALCISVVAVSIGWTISSIQDSLGYHVKTASKEGD